MANSSIRDFKKFNTMNAFNNIGFPVSYLVIAGGGGGGDTHGGGGGAGGYRSAFSTESSGGGASAESVLTLVKGVHSIIVGAGGTGGTGNAKGGLGSDSVLASIISTGGGGGGAFSLVNGLSGGSGWRCRWYDCWYWRGPYHKSRLRGW